MDVFQDLKAVMNDIKQRKNAINEQLKEFQGLQAEIRTLVQRAKTDPEAREKLLRLQQAFPQGFEQQQERVLNKVSELGKNFKKLEQEFTNLGSKPKTPEELKEQAEEMEKQQKAAAEAAKNEPKEEPKPVVKKKKVRSYL
ncbi:hypothetical protein JQC92_05075 [Shewanella sp. 202IG2-18]|uniref:hypothetical protein n=1 Tax=Parashewanella hymeniacidonis TaxID=2807618 RepID=UPI0019612192|nr:hypothetical protein [Parashewanella hymeniacidonis]MBM7071413.1 hypothetical protein [Parashewanella hymeniacidonis]